MAIYYVDSVNGLDTNNGLSEDKAFKTLQAMLNSITVFSVSDKIFLKSGVYTCDAAIITKIPVGATVDVIGLGLRTTFKQNGGWGGAASGVYPIGTGGTINFRKLIFDMTNSANLGYNTYYCTYTALNWYNVVFTNVPSVGMGHFSPYYADYKMYNCVWAGPNVGCARADAGKTVKLYSCYGKWGDGYASSTSWWNGGGNYVTGTPSLDTFYKITDMNASNDAMGVYSGTYIWNTIWLKYNGVYYSVKSDYYNTTTQQYNPLVSPTSANCFPIEDLFIPITVGSETFKPIDKFNNFQIVVSKVGTIITVAGIKTTREMIIANGDINLAVAQNIDSFTVTTTLLGGGSIKMAFSTDSGLTWKSYNGASVVNLASSVPTKSYSTMTAEEQLQWDTLRDEIYTNGMTPGTFNGMNFNLLGAQKIRFAYVIDRPKYANTVEIGQLNWQFDAKGLMQNMKDSEYTLLVGEGQVKITSLITNDIIKANIIL